MLKVLHLIDSLRIGGAQTHLLTILKHCNRAKYQHVVYSLTSRLEIGDEIVQIGIPVNYLNLEEHIKAKRWFLTIKTIVAVLKKERAPLLETHLFWSRFLGSIAAYFAGVKTVISFEQGDMYQGWQYKMSNLVSSLLINKIITCSLAMKEWLMREYNISARKIIVMNNVVNVDEFSPEGDIISKRRKFGIDKDSEIAIGCVGTLGKGINKGVEYLIRAVSEVSNVHNVKLLLIGDGELRKELEALVQKLGIARQVNFLGARRDISDFLEAIDIFVLASVFEPFGIAIIEAMAMGKPVIGTQAGGIPEIIDNGINGLLVQPKNHLQLAQAIEKLIQDKELRNGLGKAGRKKVIEKFSVQNYVKQLEGFYDKLLRIA